MREKDNNKQIPPYIKAMIFTAVALWLFMAVGNMCKIILPKFGHGTFYDVTKDSIFKSAPGHNGNLLLRVLRGKIVYVSSDCEFKRYLEAYSDLVISDELLMNDVDDSENVYTEIGTLGFSQSTLFSETSYLEYTQRGNPTIYMNFSGLLNAEKIDVLEDADKNLYVRTRE